MDEIIDAFRADAFHVGMDESFCWARNSAIDEGQRQWGTLREKAVNEIYASPRA